MKRGFLAILVALTALDAFGAVVVKLVREPGTVVFSLKQGFGVQKDGKHELTFTAVATGKTLLTLKNFSGSTAVEDKKYYSKLAPVTLPKDAGRVRVAGRIFYCSFEQKFCSVQRVDEEI